MRRLRHSLPSSAAGRVVVGGQPRAARQGRLLVVHPRPRCRFCEGLGEKLKRQRLMVSFAQRKQFRDVRWLTVATRKAGHGSIGVTGRERAPRPPRSPRRGPAGHWKVPSPEAEDGAEGPVVPRHWLGEPLTCPTPRLHP